MFQSEQTKPAEFPIPVNLTSNQEGSNPIPPSRSPRNDRNYLLWFGLLIIVLIISFAIFFFLHPSKQPETNQNKDQKQATSSSDKKPLEEKRQLGYVNSETGLNMRSKADTSSKILQTLPNGTELSILSEEGDWYLIEATSRGYVAKQYVTTTRGAAVLKVYDAGDLNFKLIYPENYKIALTKGAINVFRFTSSTDSSGGFSVSKEVSGSTISGYLATKYPKAAVKDCDITIGNARECKMVENEEESFYLADGAASVFKFVISTNYGKFPLDLTAIILPSIFFAS